MERAEQEIFFEPFELPARKPDLTTSARFTAASMPGLRPDTYMQSMGVGGTARRCLVRDRDAIQRELMRFGEVMLMNDIHDGEVFRYIPRGSQEWRARLNSATLT